MADMTPNANLRALLERVRMDRHEVSAITGTNASTVRAWLEDRSALRPEKRAHREFVESLCEALGASVADVWGVELEPMPPQAPVKTGTASPGLHLLEILLDTLEDPKAPRTRKDAARATIREWVRDAMR